MRNVLLDTGPFVALLDRSEVRHQACVDFLQTLKGRLITTEAVLTEAMYLLQGVRGGQSACLDFIVRGGAALAPASLKSLQRCRVLIKKYADCPMDFADAGLVVLAEELETADVFTLDRRGFETFRFAGKQKFNIFP